MKKLLGVKIAALCLIFCMITSGTVYAATSGYFNTYKEVKSVYDSTYTTSEGMCVDRFNNIAYVARINGSTGGRQQLLAIKNYNSSSPTSVVLKNADNNTNYTTVLGHANDLAVVASSGSSTVSLYVATMESKGIVKLTVNTSKNTYKVAGTYSYGGDSPSAITYSVGNSRFIIKSGKQFSKGYFNESSKSFVRESSFTLNPSNAYINGSHVDCSGYTSQGICYYKGILYTPLWNKNGNKGQSVVLAYQFELSNATGTISPMKNLSFRITSSAYSEQFEIESVGFDDDVMYFNANRNGAGNDTFAYFKGM